MKYKKDIDHFMYPLRRCLVSLSRICSVSSEAAMGVVSRGYDAALREILAMSRQQLLVAGAAAEAIASLMWIETNRQNFANNRQLVFEVVALLQRCRHKFNVRRNVDEVSAVFARRGKDPAYVFSCMKYFEGGRLDPKEVEQTLRGMTSASRDGYRIPDLSPEQLHTFFQKLEQDHQGLISFDELCDLIRPVEATMLRVNNSILRGLTPEKVFKRADVNNDGRLSREELCKELQTQEPEISKEECDLVFDKLDRDRSGTVTLEELVEALEEQCSAARSCLQCLAGFAHASERCALTLMQLGVLEDALDFSPQGRPNADNGLRSRQNQLVACILLNLKTTSKREAFQEILVQALETVAAGMRRLGPDPNPPEVVSWGLSALLTAMGYQELKREAKRIWESLSYRWEQEFGADNNPHVYQLGDAVQTEFNKKDYDF
jgi:Ca2+-binding EF-hand superfamily protein